MSKNYPRDFNQVRILYRFTLLRNSQNHLFRIPQSYEFSTCSGDSWQRGNGQRVIAFAFYGDPQSKTHQERGYFEGIIKNLEAISSFYNSSWSVRLYHDISSDDPLMIDLCNLACSNNRLDLCPVDQLPHHLLANAAHMFPMIWRFFPTLDSQVDAFMSRDLDSIIKMREVEAVAEWLESGKTLHVMRDHPAHSVPMLGGMWGALRTESREAWKDVWDDIWSAIIADPLSQSDRGTKGPDQTLLSRHVWGRLSGGVVQHDSFSCAQYPGAVGFPSKRPNATGNVVGAEPNRRQEHIKCPKKCRRRPSWIFC